MLIYGGPGGSAGGVYYFKGWAKTSDATSVLFTDEQNITNSTQITSNTILYAVWDPLFTITGNYEVIDDGNNNWRVKIKGATGSTSGTAQINFNKQATIDLFLVGGGGSGHKGYSAYGGCGGYTKTVKNLLIPIGLYSLNIGTGGAYSYNSGTHGKLGGATSGFEYSISGGGGAGEASGCSGGSGTNAASDGGGSVGQGSTTREFGESTGTLYSGSGGKMGQTGGAGGGGYGTFYDGTAQSGAANTGGGGGGCGYGGTGRSGAGGSGIIVIRNHR